MQRDGHVFRLARPVNTSLKDRRRPWINSTIETQTRRTSEAQKWLALTLDSIFYFVSIHFMLHDPGIRPLIADARS